MTQDLVFVISIVGTSRTVEEWEDTIRKQLHFTSLDTVRGYPMPEHDFPVPPDPSIHEELQSPLEF